MALLTACLLLSVVSLAASQSASTAASCTGDQYMSKNGLNFYTDCPAQAGNTHANSTDFDSFDTASLDDCMDQCALSRPRCYAVVYSDGVCYEYEEDLYPRNATGQRAIADASQLTPDADVLDCPYDPYSFQTVDGEEFQIICNADFGRDGGDYCPNEGYPSRCFRHADSLEECMQFCSEAHPLCKGVSWNADMLSGFGNCYLKQHPEGSSAASAVITHSAMITQKFYEELSTACPAGSEYGVAGSNYTITCKTGRVDTQNITSVHSNSLDSCLGECSSSAGDSCLGVLFDMSMLEGFRNCYLLNDTGSALTGGANMTFAERTSTGNGVHLHDGKDDGGQGSKAWIAGSAIGAVVVIIFLVGGVIWWRRHQRQRQHLPLQRSAWPSEETEAPVEVTHPMQPAEKSAEPLVRHELSDPNSERLFPPEKA